MGWLSGWVYRRAVTITEQSGGTLTDFQVRVELNSSNFDFSKANADGSDIRFTEDDGETLLPYWIEKWDSTSEEAIIWVKVPSIPANGETTIYIYYGNSGAGSESDGEAVFEFFDDFEDGVIDSEKWTEINAGDLSYCSESGGVLTITANFGDWTDHGLQSIQPVLDAGVAIEVRAQKASTNLGDCFIGYSSNWASEHREPTGGLFGYYDGDWIELGDVHENVWSRYTVKLLSSTEFKVVRDSQEWSRTRSAVSLPTALQVAGAFRDSNTVKFDFVAVRKYVVPEPTASVGSEETLIKAWDGSQWKDIKAIYYWDGSSWVKAKGAYYWNGSQWIRIF